MDRPNEENFVDAFARLAKKRRPKNKARVAVSPDDQRTRWDQEAIVEAMRRFEAQHGRRLTANIAGSRARELGVPSLTSVVNHFGSWGAGTQAAYGSALSPGTNQYTPKGELKLNVLSSTKPTKRELADRAVAWTTEEPA